MKKKYRSILELQSSSGFATLFGGPSEPAFADLVNAFPPENISKSKTTGKTENRHKLPLPERSFEPESQLDLHGLRAEKAEKKTNSYLLTQKQRGRKILRIITGKGIHSTGPGVLRDVVEMVLLEAKDKGIVAEHCWEQKQKEKSGAVLVFLS